MKVAIVDETGGIDGKYRMRLRRIAVALLRRLGVGGGSELSITFIGDVEMRGLNKAWRNIDRTTDVLSFPQEGGPDRSLLGDIVISVETAERHSAAYGSTLDEEIKGLIVHGILHLLGHDHKKSKEKELMRGLEKELLSHISEL